MTSLTFDTRLGQLFEKAVAEAIEQKAVAIICGAMDHEIYKQSCGEIRGLEKAVEILREVQTKLIKGE